MIYTGTIYVIQARTTITGPNDAIRVVWAQGEFFYLFIRVSPNILTMFNRFFYRFQDEGTQTTSRLGPRARHTTQHRHHTTSTSPTTYHPNIDGLPRHHTT